MTHTTAKVRAWFPTPQQVVLAMLALASLYATFQLWPGQQPHTVVIAAWPLPAYTLLTAADLSTQQTSLAAGALLTSTAQALGKITLSALAKGTPLQPDQLWQPSQPVTDALLLTVPFSTTVAPAPGETLLLLGVAPDADNPTRLACAAPVLGQSGERAVVLVTRAEAEKAAWYLQQDRQIIAVRPLARLVACP